MVDSSNNAWISMYGSNGLISLNHVERFQISVAIKELTARQTQLDTELIPLHAELYAHMASGSKVLVAIYPSREEAESSLREFAELIVGLVP